MYGDPVQGWSPGWEVGGGSAKCTIIIIALLL